MGRQLCPNVTELVADVDGNGQGLLDGVLIQPTVSSIGSQQPALMSSPTIASSDNYSSVISAGGYSSGSGIADQYQNHHEEVYPVIAVYFNGYLTLVVVAFGEVSNIIAFLAFYSHSVPRPNIYVYLMALCIWDGLLLPSALLMYCIPTIKFGRASIVGNYVYVIPYAFYLCSATLIGSLWMIVALCADRYMALVHPMKHRKMWKTKIRRVLFTISTVVLVYSLPHLFEFQVYHCPDRNGEMKIDMLAVSDLRSNDYYKHYYKIMGGLIIYSVCPFLLLLTLTLLIAVHLKLAAQQRIGLGHATVTMQRLQKDTTNSNNLLLSVIFKFMSSHVLPTILDASEAYLGEKVFQEYHFIHYLVDVSNFLVVLNSSTTICLYLYASTTFRNDCRRVFRGHICPRQVSALRAAAPALRATLRWQGVMVIKEEEMTFLPPHSPSLSRRRVAIPTIRSTYSVRSSNSSSNNYHKDSIINGERSLMVSAADGRRRRRGRPRRNLGCERQNNKQQQQLYYTDEVDCDDTAIINEDETTTSLSSFGRRLLGFRLNNNNTRTNNSNRRDQPAEMIRQFGRPIARNSLHARSITEKTHPHLKPIIISRTVESSSRSSRSSYDQLNN